MSASLNIRRPDDDYGEIEYGGLPVESSFQYHLVLQRNSPVRFLYSWEVSQTIGQPKRQHESGAGGAMVPDQVDILN